MVPGSPSLPLSMNGLDLFQSCVVETAMIDILPLQKIMLSLVNIVDDSGRFRLSLAVFINIYQVPWCSMNLLLGTSNMWVPLPLYLINKGRTAIQNTIPEKGPCVGMRFGSLDNRWAVDGRSHHCQKRSSVQTHWVTYKNGENVYRVRKR